MDNRKVPSNKEKAENVMIAAGVIAAALVVAVISWFQLPDYVVTQPAGFINTGAPALPKWFAVVFPFGLTTVLAGASINCRKQFFTCLFGFALSAVLLFIN